MNKPSVSIVLPSYNGERFLRQQLDSIFAQTCQDFEVIVADDGSSDKTVDILQAYAGHHNFRFYINPHNLGFIQNFCQAVQQARGQYIAPCDQDDVWQPHKLQTLLDAVKGHLLVYSDSELIDEQGNLLGKSLQDSLKVNFISGNNYRAFYYANCVAAHTMLFHRDLLAYIDTLPESVYHDHWLAFIASRLGTIQAIDEKLVLYRRHGSSVTKTVKRKRFSGNPISYLRAKAERQAQRNRSKVQKLKDFQAFNQRIDKPDAQLDSIIAQLEKFDDYFFNPAMFSILNKARDEYFAISRKGRLGLLLEECVGRKFYEYIPIT